MSILYARNNSTLQGTTANDTFVFQSGDKDKVLVNIGGEDTISISGTLSEFYGLSGDDITLNFVNNGSAGSVKIKNAVGKTLTIVDNSGSHKKKFSDYITSPQDVIKKFMLALDRTTARGAVAVDEAVKACSNFNGVTQLIYRLVGDANSAKSAREFLAEKCGIDLDNDDTGAITGWDAGGSTVKTKKTIVNETSELENFVGTGFVVDGLTVKLNDDFRALTPTQRQIVQGLKTWWTSEPLRLIAESYGENFSFGAQSSATVKELDVEFLSRPNNSNLALIKSSSINGRTTKLTLQINMAYYDEISDADGRSARKGTSYLDRVLAHEFTHAVMAANIDNFADLPAYVKEGTAELTHGIDDERQLDLVKMVENPETLRQALSAATSTEEVSFSGLNAPSYAAGYIFFRYLAKQAAIFVED